ncbi:RHS repeat domain-containing protein [Chryseobacterium lathyri]|uniref:RHS repeat domain-containing protein n=1 Tax=Chryseobacterium lathyri TaxID=395933 RepID=UPI00278B34D7|nr:RHS repeat-associated core domain-containing protein [Chryseobacterium lathyri]MDQ0065136.1 RHS repeat-associated protein [Chryseobacterium lathyri]
MSANILNNKKRSTAPFVQNSLNIYYTKEAFPTVNITVLSANYYDDYPEGSPTLPSQILTQPVLGASPLTIVSNGHSSIRSLKTMPTVSYVRNIENDKWSSDVAWYDQLAQPIGSESKNPLGGFTRTESLLDFSGRPLETFTYHSKKTTSTEITVKDRFVYSPQSFLSKHYQQINSKPEELLTDYTYNDLGQVINKKIGGGLQSIDYSYNIRGWLTGINAADLSITANRLFVYKIKYNTVEGPEVPNNSHSSLKVKPKYNGSIAEVDWKTAYGSNEPIRRYGYVYDGAQRLRAGFFQNGSNPYSKEYSEVINYDLNGNITTLNRTGGGINGIAEVMDDLKYNYLNGGNQLQYLEETGSGNGTSGYPLAAGVGQIIKYDTNGNMLEHLDKGHTKITYNFLNLPSSIASSNKGGSLNYIYGSDGTKLQMRHGTEVTDYLGNFQYTSNSLTGTDTSFILANEEGYYDFANSRYVYQYRDHLGNVRISYTKGQNGGATILEENNYYPFGSKHAGYNTGDTTNNKFKYLYNGKELQSTGNLDYGWRQYMPELGRWNGMDQLSESYHSASPYAYVMNNPVNMYDPDGRVSEDWVMNFYKNSQSGYNTIWTNTGNGFVSNWGGNMSYEGAPTNFSFGGASTGIGGGPDGMYFNIPPVNINARGTVNTWNNTENYGYNSYLMMSKLTGALMEWNYDQNSSNMGQYILNSKASREVAEFERFLFLELPAQFAGGAFFSAGWRAVGAGRYIGNALSKITTADGFLGGSIGVKLPFNLRVGLYASENTLKYETFKWSTIAPKALTKYEWFGRNMLQITPEFQPTLGKWSSQVIPKGTNIRVGLVGLQPNNGLGTWLQFYSPERIPFIP